ncbi:MAG: zinc ribbon domain-containing protein, partial [Leptolinea sp.]
MYCPKCGNKNADDAIFCSACRRSLTPANQISLPTEKPEGRTRYTLATSQDSMWFLVLGGIIVFCLLGVLIGGGAFLLTNNKSLTDSNLKQTKTEAKPTATEAASVTPTISAFSEIMDASTARSKIDDDQIIWLGKIANESNVIDETNADGKLRNYRASLDNSSNLAISEGWCAKDLATLTQNLTQIENVVIIDGKEIDKTNMVFYDYVNDTGWSCQETDVVVSKWSLGDHKVIKKMVFKTKINDGETDFNPGEMGGIYIVNVKLPSEITPTPPMVTEISPTSTPEIGFIDSKLTTVDKLTPLSNAGVILCKLENGQCTINSGLISITNGDGSFKIAGVPLGKYIVLYYPNSIPPGWTGLDGKILDFSANSTSCLGKSLMIGDQSKCTNTPIFGDGNLTMQKDSVLNIGPNGNTFTKGTLTSDTYSLYVDFRDGVPVSVDAVTGTQSNPVEEETFAPTAEPENLITQTVTPAPSRTPVSVQISIGGCKNTNIKIGSSVYAAGYLVIPVGTYNLNGFQYSIWLRDNQIKGNTLNLSIPGGDRPNSMYFDIEKTARINDSFG